MKSKHAVAALVIAAAALTSPAFAGERTSLYPEGSIFNQAPIEAPLAANRSAQTAAAPGLSPLEPLNSPEAGNLWKPSDRDAGNLGAARWQEHVERRKPLQTHQ